MALEIKEEILSNEKIFRGFRKQPVVVLDRLNIKPFLNDSRVSYKHNVVSSEADSGSIKPDLNKLSLLCSVVLVRDDLEKLKYGISKIASNNPYNSSASKCGIVYYNCNSCSKTYKSVKRLQNHLAKKHNTVEKPQPQKRVSFSDHIIVHEVQEYHRCKKCTKIFTGYKLLKKHIKQKHKKRKFYICNYCSNKFIDRIYFKTHIKLHCDSCGLLLPTKAEYLEHKRNICRNVKMYNCKTCKENYFQFMDLKDHSYEHISSCFVCDICKDQFETKCAVAHHISFLHSDKRPEVLYTLRNLGSDRLYLCNFCEESSVEKDLIESHVSVLPDLSNRAMTGYKDFYFCDQCLKKFDKETDMLQHKWSHFLKTSDNSQLRENITIKDNLVTEKESDINENVPNTTLPIAVDEIIDTNNEKSLEQVSSSKQNLSESMQIHVVDQNIVIDSRLKTFLANSIPSPSPQPYNNEAVGLHVQPIDYMNPPKKAIVDPRSKKTILSRFNCEICGKYYSSNYTLARHKATQHFPNNNLRCDICEETFVWPSLLQSHNCIRMNIPEMPFDDARPEIQFDNLQGASNGLEELNIEDDDYAVGVDFDIPAPIVELTEYDHQIITDPIPEKINHINDLKSCVQSLGYKLVIQEVPIEF
ncbi:unnamed protein product [Parnassius apollo]|uniref:(apollo) hypothetical protein n=1 Tax=Parnassius apollo TaxID=110799 RepID=A0A8S3X9J1_PARAO|nr:unnamed protein product [Parnassius apollo]